MSQGGVVPKESMGEGFEGAGLGGGEVGGGKKKWEREREVKGEKWGIKRRKVEER